MFFKKKEFPPLERQELESYIAGYSALEEGRGIYLQGFLSRTTLEEAQDVLVQFLDRGTPEEFESALEILLLILTKDRSVPGKFGTHLKELVLSSGLVEPVFEKILASGNPLKTVSLLSNIRGLETLFPLDSFAGYFETMKGLNFGLVYFFLLNFGYCEDGHLREEWLEDLAKDPAPWSQMLLMVLTARFETDHPLAQAAAQGALSSGEAFLKALAQAYLQRPGLIQAIEEATNEEAQGKLLEEYEVLRGLLDLDEAMTRSTLKVMKAHENQVTNPDLWQALTQWVLEGPDKEEEPSA